MKKLWYLCLLLASCSIQNKEIRDTQSLDGVWNFRIDSMDVGIEEQWYFSRIGADVKLPGSMAENGLGYEVSLQSEWTGSIVDSSWFYEEKYKKYRQPDNFKIPFWLKPVKHYKGVAWYQQKVPIPAAWRGGRVILHLERPHWETNIFVNAKQGGSNNSLAVPHEYDITPLLKLGNNRISIRVDNREIIPVGRNSHSISDHTQSNWNGITGRMFLQARNSIHISNVQIYPDIHAKLARLVITLQNHKEDGFDGTLEIEANGFNTERSHHVPVQVEKVSMESGAKEFEIVYPMGEETNLWSEFSPALYNLNVGLLDAKGNVLDIVTEDFGMREFIARGTRFMVNNHPVFLRGTLECCIFPLTGYPPTDQNSWERVMARCKAHGLNHIRFHSWCPPEAAFAAADREGVYLQVECSSWANSGSTLGDGTPVDMFIYEEGDRILKAYGNHPSFCMMAYGNEPGGRHQERYLGDLLKIWKSRDNRRVYTAGAGWPLIPENEYHNGPQPRIQRWGEGLQSVINADPPQTMFDYSQIISSYEIPFVSHEIGQWCVYPNFKEMRKYSGVLKPTNFEIFKETLEEHHMGDQAEDFLMASGKLQALCYKAEIEAALRTPGFAGFQLLQLHDFPGQGTALVGVLDPFFDSKGYISPVAFRRFCNQTVPLARMEKRIYTSGEAFQAGIELAHFGESALKGVTLLCTILDDKGNVLHETTFQKDEIPVENAIEIGSVTFPLEDIEEAAKLTLQIELEETPFSNSWDFWVYPQQLEAEKGDVLVTDRLDPEAIQLLSEGGAVLLLTGGNVGEAYGADVKIGFSSIFWNTAWTHGQAPHTLGILCDPDHAVFNSFPTEYHSNWQWWEPVTHSQAMILDHLPAKLKPLIQPIHTWFENKKLGLAFETRAGNGKLMVCSIDLQNDMTDRPVSRQLLYSLLKYMSSDDFDPQVEIEPELVQQMMVMQVGEGI